VSIEELFLRQIDSVDGNIEVIVHPSQPMTCVSTGPFVWQVENIDRDAVIEEIARVMAALPAIKKLYAPIRLNSGEYLELGDQLHASGYRLIWVMSGPVNVRFHESTASLLIAALCEARQWQRTQQLAATGAEVASC